MSSITMNKISFIIYTQSIDQTVLNCLKSIDSNDKVETILITASEPPKLKKSDIKIYFKLGISISEARNFGLEQATGEWVCFIDPNDKLLPNFVDTLNSSLREDSSVYKFKPEISALDGSLVYPGRELPENVEGIFKKNWNELYQYVFKTDWLKQNRIKFPEAEIYQVESDTVMLLRVSMYALRVKTENKSFIQHNIDKQLNYNNMHLRSQSEVITDIKYRGMSGGAINTYIKKIFNI